MQNQPFPQFHRLLFTWNHTSHIFLRGYDHRNVMCHYSKVAILVEQLIMMPNRTTKVSLIFWEREIGAQEPGVLSIGMLLLLGRADSAFWLGCRRRSNYEAEMRVSKTSS